MQFVSVDFQRDFTAPGGKCFRPRACVPFIKNDLVPFLRLHPARLFEIVSDYRLPRPGDEFECCLPGTPGFESEIPLDLKCGRTWIKCMNSPVWTRDFAGAPSQAPGLPRPDPQGFAAWLAETLGPPQSAGEIVLIGLTLDCCVLATALALTHRAYDVYYLVEAVDAYSGDPEEKRFLLASAAGNWGTPLGFADLSRRLSEGERP